MRVHSANELRDRVDILGPDGVTVLVSNMSAGVQNLTGARRAQVQNAAHADTSHMILFRAGDATLLTASSYIRSGGVLYIVDYPVDPQVPRPGIWLEVYCHVERTAA